VEPEHQPDVHSGAESDRESHTKYDLKPEYDNEQSDAGEEFSSYIEQNSICDSDGEVKPQFNESSSISSSDSDDDNDRYSIKSSDNDEQVRETSRPNADIKVVNIVEVEKKPIKKTKRPSFF
jgi:hypothetical protein